MTLAPRARLALVVGKGFDAGTLQAVSEACARARAEARVWRGGLDGEAEGWPALVIAPLAAGVRQIPAEILDLADMRFPGTPVLLMCDEPLVRPTLTLQQGRITLVEPPATVERVASRIRLLLASEPGAEPGRPATSLRGGTLQSREYRRPGWWAAQLVCGGDQGSGARLPRPRLEPDLGLKIAMVGPASELEDEQIARAVELARNGEEGEDVEAELLRILGPDVGLVHLTEDGRSWVIYWPCHHLPLWLFSPLRLPRWSDLALASQTSLWRIPAVPGDIVAALSSNATLGEAGSSCAFLPSTDVCSAMLDGGPALLSFLEARLGAAPRPFLCVVAEVR